MLWDGGEAGGAGGMIGGEWKVWCVALIYLKKIIVYL